MNFTSGQVVVHPHHGPATITKIAKRKIKNVTTRYLKMSVLPGELVLAVPEERAEEIGVRALLDVDGIRKVFELFLEPSEVAEKVWSRRIKANAERLRSGNILTVAALVRDLARRNEEKRLSYGEMNMLRDAKSPLVTELSIVLRSDEEAVEAMVDAAIHEGTMPVLPDTELAAAG